MLWETSNGARSKSDRSAELSNVAIINGDDDKTWRHRWVSRKCTARAPVLPNIDYQTWTNALGSNASKSPSH